LPHYSTIRKFSNAVTQEARARAEFDGMVFIPSMVWRESVQILLRRQQAREMRNPALYLPRNGSNALGGFNAFTEAEGDYY
jgi:hypothetical protein